MRECSILDCTVTVYSRHLCRKHYDSLRRSGQLPKLPARNVGVTCRVEDCSTEARGHGLCGRHYQRLYKTGDPLGLRTPAVEARFWSKVAKQGPSECWEWTAGAHREGYGRFTYEGNRAGRAHVYSYELHNGPVPPGLFVLHSCDNPPCVNPGHLSTGTQEENMSQMADRLRWPRKLTDTQMAEIRDSADTQKVLARRYGISQSYVSLIKRFYIDGMHRSFTA